jgi:hypothetical protein
MEVWENLGSEFDNKDELLEYQRKGERNKLLWEQLRLEREGWEDGLLLIGPWEGSGELPQLRSELIIEKERASKRRRTRKKKAYSYPLLSDE